MKRGVTNSITASPTMVGAVTTLIVVVAVFLAYNANNGLPFVPVHRVSVEVPNAARLVNNNEVRIAGKRVGVVESIDIVAPGDSTAADTSGGSPSGTEDATVARLNLKLDKSVEGLPKDSIFRVRYRSSFGLKYIEIVRGTGEPAAEGYVFNGTDDGSVCALPTNPATFSSSVPASAQNGCFEEQVEFDAINNTFDAPTRTNVRDNLTGFGNAFAARGTSLNDALGALEPLLRGLRPVAQTLTEPDTQLRRFFPELGDAARIVAPVATEQAELFGFAARTFTAISADPGALQETISEGVPTLETGIETLPAQNAFLRDFAVLSRELRPGVQGLRTTLPVLNEAIDVGTPVLRDLPTTNDLLRGVMRELDQLVSQPTTRLTLQRLSETFDSAKPLSVYAAPAQTVCNNFNYYVTFFANALSEPDNVGYTYRQIVAGAPPPFEVESDIASYAGTTASGRAAAAEGGVFKPFELPIANVGPYMPAGQRNADCQLGQRGYPLGETPAAGQPPSSAANLTSDLEGSRGPTTVFWNDDRQRELVDSRIESRQPSTWEGSNP